MAPVREPPDQGSCRSGAVGGACRLHLESVREATFNEMGPNSADLHRALKKTASALTGQINSTTTTTTSSVSSDVPSHALWEGGE